MPLIIDPTIGEMPPCIVTQTRAGNDIENCQASLITELDKHEAEERRKRWAEANPRSEDIVPHYNCHGLTFASRRTAVNESLEVRKIITDDKYVKVDEKDVLPGDVIVYISLEDGDIEHSGVVVALGEPPFNVPRVVSKWGKGFEVVHAANYCPYSYGGAAYYRVVT